MCLCLAMLTPFSRHVAGYHPHGAICVSGKDVPLSKFNSTNHCVDTVSVAAYDVDNYYQWPDHCIQHSFGSEFDPFLK